MHETTERLYQAVQAIKTDMLLTKANVSRFLNISQQVLKNWEDRPTGISKQGMFDIEKQTGISAVWLESGNGEMLIKKQEDRPQIMFDMFGGSDNLEIDDKYITFTALGYSDIKEIKAIRYWAREELGGNLHAIRVLTMNSDSMSGTIEDGSVLFVDESVRYFNGDGVYVLLTPDGLKIKRLQMTVSGSLNVISDNPKYPIEVISPKDIDDIRICGKVKGCWQMKRL